MCYLNAIKLDVFPFNQMIKVGDTVADIKEGLNAGMWTIGLTKSGNEVGFSEEGIKDVAEDVLKTKIKNAELKLKDAGAHFVIDGIWDLLPIVEEISNKIENGEKP
jgi:phosphonoacetaldehyde hydrolase